MSTPNVHRNHEQLISLSERLNADVKTIGQDVLNQIQNRLYIRETSNCFLLLVINRIVGDTFNVIGALQEIVIKITEEESARITIGSEVFEKRTVELEQVIQTLRQYCNEMVQEYNNSSTILKQKFLELVHHIILEAECLLNIIKSDDLSDYKHQLVENLGEILFTIHITQVRIQIQSHIDEENYAAENLQKEFINNIVKIEKCSLEVLKNLLIHIKHILKHNYQAVSYLHKMVSNFDDAEIQKKIWESANSMNIVTTTFFIDSENCNSIQEIIATLKNASIYFSLSELILFIHRRNENKNTPESLIDELMMYFFVHGSVINKQIGKINQQDVDMEQIHL